jgi:hypothetical protein
MAKIKSQSDNDYKMIFIYGNYMNIGTKIIKIYFNLNYGIKISLNKILKIHNILDNTHNLQKNTINTRDKIQIDILTIEWIKYNDYNLKYNEIYNDKKINGILYRKKDFYKNNIN